LAWFERGLGEVGGVTTPESWLERGWLHNGLALLAWQDHRAGEAEALVEHALEFMATYDDVQALNLQINLLNNLSVLHEQRDNHGLALRTWQRLAHWAELLDGGTFAKSYLYRESWLYLLVGDLPAARDACARAFAIAEQVRDFFHMDLLSRACGYLACRLRRFDEALYWYEYYQLLSAKLDDHWRLPEAWAALGHAAVQAGEFVRARDAFRAGVEAAEAVGRGELAEQLRRAVDVLVDPGRVDGLDADGEFCGFRLERPKAKLTTPFALAHLSSATAFAPATHRGLRGATHDSSR